MSSLRWAMRLAFIKWLQTFSLMHAHIRLLAPRLKFQFNEIQMEFVSWSQITAQGYHQKIKKKYSSVSIAQIHLAFVLMVKVVV